MIGLDQNTFPDIIKSNWLPETNSFKILKIKIQPIRNQLQKAAVSIFSMFKGTELGFEKLVIDVEWSEERHQQDQHIGACTSNS